VGEDRLLKRDRTKIIRRWMNSAVVNGDRSTPSSTPPCAVQNDDLAGARFGFHDCSCFPVWEMLFRSDPSFPG
jgi:hypothetical protein